MANMADNHTYSQAMQLAGGKLTPGGDMTLAQAEMMQAIALAILALAEEMKTSTNGLGNALALIANKK